MNYWMFSGEGISSRFFEQCLLRLSGDEQHQSKLGLPLHPDNVYSEYYRKHIPFCPSRKRKMRFECGMLALYQAEATFEAFLGSP